MEGMMWGGVGFTTVGRSVECDPRSSSFGGRIASVDSCAPCGR